MKIYRVGGAVRDALLGLPVKDIDYVVLGSTPEQMVAAGFTPVGKDFPVFLHPHSHAEYALARTERKSAPGYHGFVFHCAPDVTLEEDLQRRDLTINAMAISDDIEACAHPINPADIIDPYGGQRDLAAKLFRHVSPAFTEDPVRILRIARFAARFNSFSVAPETMQLMRDMVAAGEVDALIPERVWQEIARGLMEQHPARMMLVLHESGALARIMPELALHWNQAGGALTQGQQLQRVVDQAAQHGSSLAVRWACMMAELVASNAAHPQKANETSAAVQQLCARLKVPTEVRDTSVMAARERYQILQTPAMSAQHIVELFERCDAFRRPQRFAEVVQAVTLNLVTDVPQRLLAQALVAAQAIASGKIAQAVALQFPKQPQKIAEQILIARIAAVDNSLNNSISSTT